MAIVFPPSATFLHIPKCGGTWVLHALSALGLPLDTQPEGLQHCIAATEGRFVFTFVRHPLTWYQSFWKYRITRAEAAGGLLDERIREAVSQANEEIDECLVDHSGRPASFADFVRQCVLRHPGFLSHKFGLYTAKAHFVGRQESLHADFLNALDRAGVVYDPEVIGRLPRANETGSKLSCLYPPDLAGRLLAAEGEAMKRFYSDLVGPPPLLLAA
jgi:hypothetical protein